MKHRILSLLVILMAGLSVLAQTQRPKVAVVLSGGGAKGAAHVKALKVIEEAGIPIDMVVGTSMGALVGGLYSAGYTTEDLERILTHQNWKNLLMNLTERHTKDMNMKMNTDRYTFAVFFDKSPNEIIQGGVLKGEQVGQLLSDLTAGLHDDHDYNRLPIPFACVATDIVTGQEIDIHHGVLAESMRASMAIPGVFSPVKLGDKVLVDGGMVNNYPVDVARNMGADVVIGVDLGGGGRKADEIKSVFDVLGQTLEMVCRNKYEENLAATDIHIKVDVSGYSSASFNVKDIDSLMTRGEIAARGKWDELKALRMSLEKYGNVSVKPHKGYAFTAKPNETPVYNIIPQSKRTNMMGIGARFDNEELASVMLGGSYLFYPKRDLRAMGEVRLGKRIYGTGSFQFRAFEKVTWTTSYTIGKNEIKLNSMGKLAGQFEYTEHNLQTHLTRSWMEVFVDLGMRYNSKSFGTTMTAMEWQSWQSLSKTSVLDIFLNFKFDSQDDTYYPTKGIRWYVNYALTPWGRKRTNNLDPITNESSYQYMDYGKVDHAVSALWEIAVPIHKVVLIPSVSGRYITANNDNPTNYNYVGGVGMPGHYLPQQLPFAGIDYMEMMPNAIAIGALKARYNVYKNHHVYGIFNYARTWSSIPYAQADENLVGWALGYSYRSVIGPLSAHIDWSNHTKKVGFFINIGYVF